MVGAWSFGVKLKMHILRVAFVRASARSNGLTALSNMQFHIRWNFRAQFHSEVATACISL